MANQTHKVGTIVGGILHELFNEDSEYSEIKLSLMVLNR